MHLNVCVFIRKRISVNAALGDLLCERLKKHMVGRVLWLFWRSSIQKSQGTFSRGEGEGSIVMV